VCSFALARLIRSVVFYAGTRVTWCVSFERPMRCFSGSSLKSVRLLLSCVLTPNKPEFERLVEAAISLLSSKLQSGPSDVDRGFYTALLSELCLVEEDGPTSTNSSFYYGHRLKCRSGSDTSSRLGGAIRGAADMEGSGNAGAEACEPSAVAVRRVSALSAALGGVTILRKVGRD
jgi:hypothetical protein